MMKKSLLIFSVLLVTFLMFAVPISAPSANCLPDGCMWDSTFGCIGECVLGEECIEVEFETCSCELINECHPGEVRICGEGKCEGDQECDPDGFWGPCDSEGTSCGECLPYGCGEVLNTLYGFDPPLNEFAFWHYNTGEVTCNSQGQCIKSCTYNDGICADDDLDDQYPWASCHAECDEPDECADTDCDTLDGCYEGRYRDCDDVSNSCDIKIGCSCQDNDCPDPLTCEPTGTDNDRDGWDAECGDCDDSDATVYPGAPELCDNKDNDCDREVDEGMTEPCGQGDCEGTSTCTAGVWSDCDSEDRDCGTCALCDADGICSVYDETQDVDCNPFDLPALGTCTWDPDEDDLTWDSHAAIDSECSSLFRCTYESGYFDYSHTCNILDCGAECETNGDCADTECDQEDGCYNGTYRDYFDVPNTCGDCLCSDNACTEWEPIITDLDRDGYDTECDNDCDDSDATVYPGAKELCDGIDNDCDGDIDEDVTKSCGEYECEGTSTCTAGVWSDCDSEDRDCGTCALCDADGICSVYDETQDVDCNPFDLPALGTCTWDPDEDDLTWDSHAAIDSECSSLFRCTYESGYFDYSHTCNILDCDAECETNDDCDPKIVDIEETDWCLYDDSCLSCECNYESRDFCHPGEIFEGMCYWGEQECTEDGCSLNIEEIEEWDCDMREVCDPELGPVIEIELEEGWNLISIPIVPDNPTISEVIGDADVSWVYSYDSLDPNADAYGWLSYEVGVGGSLGEMNAGRGYWILANNDTVIKVKGDLLEEQTTPPSVKLANEWNLIGHYGVCSKPVYCSLFSLIDTTVGYPRWSALYDYDETNDDFIGLDVRDDTQAEEGYWIEMDVEDSYGPATTCWWGSYD